MELYPSLSDLALIINYKISSYNWSMNMNKIKNYSFITRIVLSTEHVWSFLLL